MAPPLHPTSVRSPPTSGAPLRSLHVPSRNRAAALWFRHQNVPGGGKPRSAPPRAAPLGLQKREGLGAGPAARLGSASTITRSHTPNPTPPHPSMDSERTEAERGVYLCTGRRYTALPAPTCSPTPRPPTATGPSGILQCCDGAPKPFLCLILRSQTGTLAGMTPFQPQPWKWKPKTHRGVVGAQGCWGPRWGLGVEKKQQGKTRGELRVNPAKKG